MFYERQKARPNPDSQYLNVGMRKGKVSVENRTRKDSITRTQKVDIE